MTLDRRIALAGLALFTVVFPLLVLAASPHALLPGLPRYRYDPLAGDAYGYYYGVRQIISVLRRDAPFVLAAALVGAVLVVVVWRRSTHAAVRMLAVAWGCGIVAAAIADRVQPSGAGQFGWPLVWSVPMLPLAAVGGPLGPNVAYGLGLVVALACNVAVVFAAFNIARGLGLGQRLALLGAALVAFWPLLSLLSGHKASWNGTWQNWLGLSASTEPLSTALVVVALAIVVDRRFGERGAASAGVLLGLGTLVRLTNVVAIACILVWLLAARRLREAVLLAVGALAALPAVIAYWPKGYPALPPRVFSKHPFAFHYARISWTHNFLWHPLTLVVLVPLALAGIARADRSRSALLWACVAGTALVYTFYYGTWQHPRFLFVVLPIVLVYWAAGAAVLLGKLTRGR
ncbi:MAG TPA: hypothetical protein VHC67_19280 [Gaiellaceae bacterium]|nr:hypothetical protein [Gaiellaceae bacterium]